MDVVSAAVTICSLCQRILTWVAQLSEKQVLLADISITVLQIHDLLHPFTAPNLKRDGTGEAQLSQAIRSVAAVLRRIEEHCQVYSRHSGKAHVHKVLAFLAPGAVIQKLKDDQTQLNHQLVILLASIAAVGYFRDHAKDAAVAEAVIMTEESDKALVALTGRLEITNGEDEAASVLDVLKSKDATQFWRDYIGAKVDFAATDLFRARLISWSNGELSTETCDLILMRLDEFNSGVITPQNLGRALTSSSAQSLRVFVDTYISIAQKPPPTSTDPEPMYIPAFTFTSSSNPSKLRLPLLIWVDDRPENNAFEAEFARSMGVHVVQLLSTAEAKLWVDEHIDFLRKYDDPARIRFISDNVRLESIPFLPPPPSSSPSLSSPSVPTPSTSPTPAPSTSTAPFLNASAGQLLLHHLRGHLLLSTPVLIYTGSTVRWTRFVRTYTAAGSTADESVCLAYISNLAVGVRGDGEWRGFDVRAGAWGGSAGAGGGGLGGLGGGGFGEAPSGRV